MAPLQGTHPSFPPDPAVALRSRPAAPGGLLAQLLAIRVAVVALALTIAGRARNLPAR